MGEVYRALDVRLNRTVAIKVLASHLSSTPERKQRMQREARAISSFSHPNICQLYDIGSQGDTDYLVMEFLEGETLADRMLRGAMSLTEVCKIGVAIADALALAHRQGIVHRDLKPGNVMLTPGGAKLMDFGLAKPLNPNASNPSSHSPPAFTAAPTLTRTSGLGPLTTAGSLVGTVQYMSPEQIEGKEADPRSDIFALGAVLYEIYTGKPPFSGKSQISVASSILDKEPDPISSFKPQTPPAFEHVVTVCLRKNPEERYQSAQDVKVELQWIAAEGAVETSGISPTRSARRERLAWGAALLAAIALAIAALNGYSLRHAQPLPGMRAIITAPPKTSFNLEGDFAGPPVLSPDGTLIAFAATDSENNISLWLRPVNSLDARVLPDTKSAMFPFWSPDSHSLGFFADSKLKTIEINGSSAQPIADAPFGRGGAWGAGSVIIFSPNTQSSLMRVSSNGGIPVNVTNLEVGRHTSHRWPFFLPDGRHFLYLAIHHDADRSANDTLYYASLDGSENRALLSSHSNAVYAAGFLLFSRDDQLMGYPLDAATGKLSGAPQTVARGVVSDVSTWHTDASASENGLLVVGTGARTDWQLVWVTRGEKQITPVAEHLVNPQLVRIAPQGDRIALQLDNAQSDIWILDLARGGPPTRLTFGPVSNQYPVWSPDGKWIAYSTARNGHFQVYRKLADGSGAEELLLTDEQEIAATDWSRDGKYLLYSRASSGSNWEIWTLPLAPGSKPYMVVPHALNRVTSGGRFSPDGRWIVYASGESGASEVYVAGFGPAQGRWQVSSSGGRLPQWSRNGKELYYMDEKFTFFAVPIREVGGALQFGTSEPFVREWSAPNVFYDAAGDGSKFLLDRISQHASQSVTVLTNFPSGLMK